VTEIKSDRAGPDIILFISYEDEQETMAELGLIKGQ